MSRVIHVFRTPDRFVAGTVGEPGDRTFYLQAVDEAKVMDDAEEGPDAVRVFLSLEQARAFAGRAERVISAGRKPCPLCAEPLGPHGHICPRQNGYRRQVEA